MGRQEKNMAGCWFSRCIYINFKFVEAKTWEKIGFMPSDEIERGITNQLWSESFLLRFSCETENFNPEFYLEGTRLEIAELKYIIKD